MTERTLKTLKGRVALITGANKGIGLEIARQLAASGATALIGARDAGRGEKAAKALAADRLDARFIRIDVTDRSSIDQGASRIESDFGKLDILVNNAGIGIDNAPPSQLEMDVLRRTYETNFFGVFAVIKAMLPLLRKSDAARIVNISSGLGSLTQNSDPGYQYAGAKLLAYNSSKSALNALTIQFAHELRNTPIKVNSADPGYVATDLNNHRGTRTVEQGAKAAVTLATLPPDGPTGGYFDEDGAVPW
jgi:NAD(P)-dependent dehydrogenase (short-subunit alcohol dehydrogenase family)